MHNAFSLLYTTYTSVNPAYGKMNALIDVIKIIKTFQVKMPGKVQKNRDIVASYPDSKKTKTYIAVL